MIEAATKNSELKPYYVNRLERGLRGETPISREGQVLSRLQEKGLGIRENAPSRETADTLRNRGRMGKPDDVAAIVAHQRTGRKRNGILFLVYEKGQDRPPKLVTKTELENKDAELVRAYMEKVAGGGGQEADLAQLNLATRPYGREEYGPDGARDRSTGPVVSYGGVPDQNGRIIPPLGQRIPTTPRAFGDYVHRRVHLPGKTVGSRLCVCR